MCVCVCVCVKYVYNIHIYRKLQELPQSGSQTGNGGGQRRLGRDKRGARWTFAAAAGTQFTCLLVQKYLLTGTKVLAEAAGGARAGSKGKSERVGGWGGGGQRQRKPGSAFSERSRRWRRGGTAPGWGVGVSSSGGGGGISRE